MSQETCQFGQSVDAYHDGELSPAERERFERHLASCPACTQDLESIRAITRRLASAKLPAIPADVLGRLHRDAPSRTVRRREDRAVLRIAEALTAAAAAILIVGSVGLFRTAQSSPSSTSSSAGRAPVAAWERAAVTLQVDDASADRQDPTQLAAWTAEDFAP